MYLPSLLRGRVPNSPCPQADGSQIGNPLSFELLCGTVVNGRKIATTQAGSMNDCLSQCTHHHGPRCDGVQFTSGGQCIMLANINGKTTTPSLSTDSAIAQMPNPGPGSDCNLLGDGSVQTNIGTRFQLACNSVWNGDDYDQQFHMSLESCIGACASNVTGCGGISYEPSQAFGFNNCYLKTKAPATSDKLMDHANTDTAIMASQDNDEDDARPVTAVVSVTSTVTMDKAESTKVVLTTRVMTSVVPATDVPFLKTPQSGVVPAATSQPETEKPSSTSMIAGTVVGVLVLLALASLATWFFRRQRRNSVPAPDGAVRGSGMAWQRLDGEVRGEGGVAPLVRTETIITVSSKNESLRDSQNGLKQHQWPKESPLNPRAGIPPEFEGPP